MKKEKKDHHTRNEPAVRFQYSCCASFFPIGKVLGKLDSGKVHNENEKGHKGSSTFSHQTSIETCAMTFDEVECSCDQNEMKLILSHSY